MQNRGFIYRERIGPEAVGLTLLAYLTRRRAHSTESEWRSRIRAGLVRLAGREALPETLLSAGDRLSWHRPAWTEPTAPQGFAVLHRDAELLAVAKPAGLPVLPGAGFLESTLLARVRTLHPEATPLHRLGRFTSGLVLFARTAAARSRIQGLWRAGKIRRLYRALAAGEPPGERFEVRAPIGPVPHPRLGRVHAARRDGRAARSLVRTLETRTGLYLAEVEILTGRPHQVRIHLAVAGTPLLGDPLYAPGGGLRADPGLPGDAGYRLHSAEIELEHPLGGPTLRLRCAPPRELRLG